MAKRKYNLNEKIFKKVNTEEQAYWLGFFSGDGNISENSINLTLKASDYPHLLKWKKFTKWNGKDYYYKKTNSWRVSFRSTKIKKDLFLFGVTPRKTFTIKFPYNMLNKKLIHHYIRGLFDADGSIFKRKIKEIKPNGKVYFYDGGGFDIAGNMEFLREIQDIVFIGELNLPKNSLKSHQTIGSIRYGGIDQLAKIYHYLYDNSSICLQRKKSLFEEILIKHRRLKI